MEARVLLFENAGKYVRAGAATGTFFRQILGQEKTANLAIAFDLSHGRPLVVAFYSISSGTPSIEYKTNLTDEKAIGRVTREISKAVAAFYRLRIATGALQSEIRPHRQTLRAFQDETLAEEPATWVDVTLYGRSNVSCAVHITSTHRDSSHAVPRSVLVPRTPVRFDLSATCPLFSGERLWLYFFKKTLSDDDLHSSDMVYAILVLPLAEINENVAYTLRHIVTDQPIEYSVSLKVGTRAEIGKPVGMRELRTGEAQLASIFSQYIQEAGRREALYRPACRLPSGTRLRASDAAPYAYNPLFRLPVFFFFLECAAPSVEQLYPEGCNDFAENLVNIVCYLHSITLDDYYALTGQRLRIFVGKLVTLVGSVIAYTPDKEGDFFSKPSNAPSLARAQADCEDLCTVCIRVTRMLLYTDSDLLLPVRKLLAQYTPVACLITSKGNGRPGDEDGPSADCLHEVAVLMPTVMLVQLCQGPGKRKPDSSYTDAPMPILLECMANAQMTVVTEKTDAEYMSEPFQGILRPFLKWKDMVREGIYGDLYKLYVCDWRGTDGVGLSGEYAPITNQGKDLGVAFSLFLSDPLGQDLQLAQLGTVTATDLAAIQLHLYDETRLLDSLRFAPYPNSPLLQAPTRSTSGDDVKFLQLVDSDREEELSELLQNASKTAARENGVSDLKPRFDSSSHVYLCGDLSALLVTRKDHSKRF